MPSTVSSSIVSIPWGDEVAKWYAGGPQPPTTIKQAASSYGIADHPPADLHDRIRGLALAGVTEEQIIGAFFPHIPPVDVIDIIDRIPDDVPLLLEEHLRGFTPLEIEQRHGLSRPKVYYWLKKLGLKPHKRSRDELTARQRSQIVKAYNYGEPMATIARRFNVSYDQVRYAVSKS